MMVKAWGRCGSSYINLSIIARGLLQELFLGSMLTARLALACMDLLKELSELQVTSVSSVFCPTRLLLVIKIITMLDVRFDGLRICNQKTGVFTAFRQIFKAH